MIRDAKTCSDDGTVPQKPAHLVFDAERRSQAESFLKGDLRPVILSIDPMNYRVASPGFSRAMRGVLPSHESQPICPIGL
jgi:hypothetical protein